MTNDLSVKSDSILMVIERIALDPKADVSKLEKMLEMQERIMAKQAEIDFNIARTSMQAELPVVMKTKSNQQTKSKYATLENINKEIIPILSKHGFSVSFRNDWPDGVVKVTAILRHKSGHSEENSVVLPYDKTGIQGSVNKTDVHAIASSITYGERYAICGLLNITIGEDDDGIRGGTKTISLEQAAELDNQITITKSDKGKFLEFMGIKDIRDLPLKDLGKANNALKAKERKNDNT